MNDMNLVIPRPARDIVNYCQSRKMDITLPGQLRITCRSLTTLRNSIMSAEPKDLAVRAIARTAMVGVATFGAFYAGFHLLPTLGLLAVFSVPAAVTGVGVYGMGIGFAAIASSFGSGSLYAFSFGGLTATAAWFVLEYHDVKVMGLAEKS